VNPVTVHFADGELFAGDAGDRRRVSDFASRVTPNSGDIHSRRVVANPGGDGEGSVHLYEAAPGI
jgi:hypothetical protein